MVCWKERKLLAWTADNSVLCWAVMMGSAEVGVMAAWMAALSVEWSVSEVDLMRVAWKAERMVQNPPAEWGLLKAVGKAG